MGDDTKKRIAIFSIFTGNYTVFYKQFVKSIAFDFLPECDKHFIICTDKKLENVRCVDGKVTQYIIDDMPFPYITLLRYKIFNEQINDAINDYDYVFFLNSNARCFTQITCSDINLESDYTFTLHDNHLNESCEEKPFERNEISTACFSDSWVNPEYVGGRFFGAKPSKFKEMFLTLEKNVKIDLENDFISAWWDEGHLNWFYNTYKKDMSHNLLSVNYHVQEQHDHREHFTDKKMWYIDKNKRRYKKMFKNRGTFGEIFIKFARKINLSLLKYDEQKLKKFCELSKINYEERYTKISNNLKLMNSFVCYLKTEELIDKTKIIEVPKVSDFTVIIPEDRILPHFEFLLRDAIDKLPNFSVKLICTKKSFESMQTICNNINENIQIIDSEIEKFDQNSYNNLFLSKDFWNKIDAEHILIYQQDAIIFRKGIDEFLEYDYIGAPWPSGSDDNIIGVGNGGFSFRKKSAMLRCLETISPSKLKLGETTRKYIELHSLDNPPEDVYYSKTMLDFHIGKVADRETANKFSQERIFSENPFGGHQYWIADKYLEDEHKKNILVIDDKIAYKSQGQGFGRAQDILTTMSSAFNVTLFPTNFIELDRDARMDYYSLLKIQTILKPRNKYGDQIFEMVGDYIKSKPNYYDIIYISRPHNFGRVIEYCKKYSPESKIVYDAEALFYERLFLQHKLFDKPTYKFCEEQKENELSFLESTEYKIVVSESEKNKIVDAIKCDSDKISVYGHALNVIENNSSFDDRKDLFFLGAFVSDESPNTDAILYFVNEIFPLVSEKINCKLIIGGDQPTKIIKELETENIKVKGFIEDPKKYYRGCKLFVAPHRFAGGIPYKISESMANGLPVVGSSLMAKQMNLSKDTMGVGSSADEIASEIIDLYTNAERWNSVKSNATKFIQETHNPSILNKQLIKYLNEI